MFKPRKQGRSAASRGTTRGSNRVSPAPFLQTILSLLRLYRMNRYKRLQKRRCKISWTNCWVSRNVSIKHRAISQFFMYVCTALLQSLTSSAQKRRRDILVCAFRIYFFHSRHHCIQAATSSGVHMPGMYGIYPGVVVCASWR